ncbi:MAG: nuclear transport factor 2 family protein [Myxococcales bacterium]|nr:nuclear transport factor 2 family protein [Myxococcales bacterium]
MITCDLDHQLNALIIAGKSVEALRTLYAEDVVAQENDEPERVGRDAWIQARQTMETNIKRFHARVIAHAAHGDTTFSEWEYNLEIEGMGPLKMNQVAVRRWRDGLVVRERFYHE